MSIQELNRGTAPILRKMAPLRGFSHDVLDSDDVVPIVLEFHQPPAVVYRRLNPQADLAKYQAELAAMHREFIEKMLLLGLDVRVGQTEVFELASHGTHSSVALHDFTYVFNGLGVLMPGRGAAQVAQMTGIRAVTYNQERVYLNLDKSVPATGARRIWERVDLSGRGIRGDGVIIAVIDTGLDWKHPALGGFENVPNAKVIHAVSYTGEPPIDNYGHGTHVAAIIAADPDYKGTPRGDSAITGMAPKALLMGYKVLTAAGSGSSTNIILALEDAVKRGAHVINLSLGDQQGDPLSPESSAANNAMLAGVVVCIAAGNAGPASGTIGAPGSAHHVITMRWT